MNEQERRSPFNTPQFVREREAWYKAGANIMCLYTSIGVLIVGGIAVLVSEIFNLSAYETAFGIVCGTWVCSAVIQFYVAISARDIASRGGVEVDRF